MKNRILFIILLFICFTDMHAYHKDTYVQKNYGNVKTFAVTPFKNYGSIVNLEIVGKLVQKLSKRLKYRDTIIIEFRHDYSDYYPKITIVEKNNPSSIFLINDYLTTLKKRQKKSYRPKKDRIALCIRQISKDIDILEILKLVEYSIMNKVKTNLTVLKLKNTDDYTKVGNFDLKYKSLDLQLLNEIIAKDKSDILNELTNEKIEFINFSGVKGFYHDNTYCFETDNLKYKTDNLKFLTPLNQGICVFNTNTSFIYLSNQTEKIKSHKLEIESNGSFYSDNFNYFIGEKVEKGIMIYKTMTRYYIIFSEEKNEIIEELKY